jgi:ABC-type sulfate transport system permease component
MMDAVVAGPRTPVPRRVVLRDLNLIHLFDFYLALLFLVSTYLRFRQYEAVVRLVRAVPERWPRLFQLVREHHTIFFTWSTALPAVLALGLSVVHTLACRWVWPHAQLTAGQIAELPVAVPVVVMFGVAMVTFDAYATFTVGELDRPMLEKYFDQAEYWLRSWVAPVVHVFTLGRISPRRMVAEEVRKALVEASRLLNATLWWVNVQVTLRIAFGLSLWLTYALA